MTHIQIIIISGIVVSIKHHTLSDKQSYVYAATLPFIAPHMYIIFILIITHIPIDTPDLKIKSKIKVHYIDIKNSNKLLPPL